MSKTSNVQRGWNYEPVCCFRDFEMFWRRRSWWHAGFCFFSWRILELGNWKHCSAPSLQSWPSHLLGCLAKPIRMRRLWLKVSFPCCLLEFSFCFFHLLQLVSWLSLSTSSCKLSKSCKSPIEDLKAFWFRGWFGPRNLISSRLTDLDNI